MSLLHYNYSVYYSVFHTILCDYFLETVYMSEFLPCTLGKFASQEMIRYFIMLNTLDH